MSGSGRRTLRREGRVLGRYLLGEEPGAAFVDRYAAAVEARLPGPPGPVVRFVRRHPGALPLLDAAAALARPDGDLRGRLLVMAAVLEASPEHAEVFLPRSGPPARQAADVAAAGLLGLLKAVAGLPLLALARRLG